MADIPANMATCRFTGKVVQGVMDTTDTDTRPDAVGIPGLRATITAEVPGGMIRNALAGTIVLLDSFYLESDSAGILRNPITDAAFVDAVASNDADINPTNWTYEVRLHIPGSREIARFSVAAPAGGTIDLSSVIPVAASVGTDLASLQDAIAQMNAARDATIAAAAGGGGGADPASIGDLSTLTTVFKTHLVGAINEVDAEHVATRLLVNGGATNLSALTTANKTSLVLAANEIKSSVDALRTLINGNVSNLAALTTTNKTNLVAAINEIDAALGTAVGIADASTGTATTWSSQKINDMINASKTSILNAAPAALDTLNELAAALGDDANFATTMSTALGNRVRVDIAGQGLTTQQKANARTNIDAASAAQGATADSAVQPSVMNAALLLKADADDVAAMGALRLRVDTAAQGLTTTQKNNAWANLGGGMKIDGTLYPNVSALPATGASGVVYVVVG